MNLQNEIEEVLASPDRCIEVFGKKELSKTAINALQPGLKAAQSIFDQIEETQLTTPRVEPDVQLPAPVSLQLPDEYMQRLSGIIATAQARVRGGGSISDLDALAAAVNGSWSRKAIILVPTSRPLNPHTHFSLMAQTKKQPWVGYQHIVNTVIQRARNLLARDFLRSEAEWSIWQDDDVVPPFGDPGYFYHFLKADEGKIPPAHYRQLAVERILSHGKTIVGGVYFERVPGGRSITQPGLHPRDSRDREIEEQLSKSPIDKLVEVGYVATGFCAVHRRVYEDIMRQFPERAPKHEGEPWDFFGHDVGHGGEDIEFCRLAKESGHKCWLDMNLWSKHIGAYAY